MQQGRFFLFFFSFFYLGSVDGLAASSVASSEVTTLQHELLDDTVELAVLEVEGLAALAYTLLTSAEGTEVLGSLGHNVVTEEEDNATSGATADGDVKEDLGAGCGRIGVAHLACCTFFS